MPELPEVEVTRLSFAAHIAGARILGVRLGKPLRWPLHVTPDSLVGRQVVAVRRRGKYLLLDLDDGLLLMHLGMSGSLSFSVHTAPAGKHDHFELVTTQGVLRLNDPRRFGAVVFAQSESDPVAHKLLGKLGVEPLGPEFDPLFFFIRNWPGARHRSSKSCWQVRWWWGSAIFMRRRRCFWRAFDRPVPAARLSRPRVARLHLEIRNVLARAVEKGGSALRDFSNAQGDEGYFQLEAMVYGRTGLPCRICSAPVRMIRQGQRSTFFCPQCQKP